MDAFSTTRALLASLLLPAFGGSLLACSSDPEPSPAAETGTPDAATEPDAVSDSATATDSATPDASVPDTSVSTDAAADASVPTDAAADSKPADAAADSKPADAAADTKPADAAADTKPADAAADATPTVVCPAATAPAGTCVSRCSITSFFLKSLNPNTFFKGTALSADGTKVAVGLGAPGDTDGTWIVRLDTGVGSKVPDSGVPSAGSMSLAFTPDGSALYRGYLNRVDRLQIASGTPTTLITSAGTSSRIAPSADGTKLYVEDAAFNLPLATSVAYSTGKKTAGVPTTVLSVAVSQDGARVAYGSSGGALAVLATATSTVTNLPAATVFTSNPVAFASADRLLWTRYSALSSESKLLAGPPTATTVGTVVYTVPGGEAIQGLSASADGRTVLLQRSFDLDVLSCTP